MTKEELLKIEGMTEGIADTILTKYVPKDVYERDIAAREAQVQKLKESDISEELKKQITEMQETNEALKLNHAVELALKDAGARNIKAVLPFINDVALDKNGNLVGLKEQLDDLKKTDGYLFAEAKPTGTTPVKKTAAPTGITKDQFNKMNYKERVELFNNDKDLYDQLTKEL